jgi:glycosyltransferase involved in cell wall biosynthesis
VIVEHGEVTSLTIDVILPFHKFNPFLVESISSIKATQGVSVRIIAVNDSGIILQKNEIGLRTQDVLVKSAGKGYIDALATGVATSTANYIAFQDSDDFSDSYRLKFQLDNLVANSFDFVTGQLVRTNAAGQISHLASPFGLLPKLLTPSERLIFGPYGADSSILARANILKSTWSTHGQFSPSFADYGWLLSVSPQIKLGYSPNAIYYYRAHRSQMSRNANDMSEWAKVARLWAENIAQFNSVFTSEEGKLLSEIKSNPKISLAIAFPGSLVKLTREEKRALHKTFNLIQKITQRNSGKDHILIREALFRRGFIASRGLEIRYWGAGIRMIKTILFRYFQGIKPRIGK